MEGTKIYSLFFFLGGGGFTKFIEGTNHLGHKNLSPCSKLKKIQEEELNIIFGTNK